MKRRKYFKQSINISTFLAMRFYRKEKKFCQKKKKVRKRKQREKNLLKRWRSTIFLLTIVKILSDGEPSSYPIFIVKFYHFFGLTKNYYEYFFIDYNMIIIIYHTRNKYY